MKLRGALFILAFAFIASPLVAQQGTLTRNSILRSDSSNTSTALEHLKKGARLTLLSNTSEGGYYHVTAGDGQQGWVWGRNLSHGEKTSNSSQSTSGPSSTSDNSG